MEQTRFALFDLRDEDLSRPRYRGDLQKYLELPVFFSVYREGRKLGFNQFEQHHNAEYLSSWYSAVIQEGLNEPENLQSLLDSISKCGDQYTTLVFVDLESSEEVSSLEQKIHSVVRFEQGFGSFTVHDASMAAAIGIPEPVESGKLWAFPCHPVKPSQEPVPVPLEADMVDTDVFDAILTHSLPGLGRIHKLLQKRGSLLYDLTLVVAMTEEDLNGKLGRVLSSLKGVQVMWDEPEKIKGGFQRAGASGYVWPAAVAVQSSGATVFNENDTMDAKNLFTFLKQVREGTYPPFVRSEKPYEYEGELMVSPLFNVNFDERVRQSTVPSIVMFYIEQTLAHGKVKAAFDATRRMSSYFKHHGQSVQLFTFNVERNAPPPEHEHGQLPQFIMYIPSPDGTGEMVVDHYRGKFALRPITQWADSLLQRKSRRLKHDEL